MRNHHVRIINWPSPFDDEDIRNLLLKVKAGHFTIPPQLSSQSKDLIWCMSDVDPKK